MRLSEPCETRPIRSLGVWRAGAWRLKAYTISYRGRPVAQARVAQARETALALLPAAAEDVPGVGYAGLHQGRGYDVLFVDWWANENELFHRILVAEQAPAAPFAPPKDPAFAACVWDMRVMAHERDAWLECVLRNPAGPDLDAYLARTLEEEA